jgi:hypothetical protein
MFHLMSIPRCPFSIQPLIQLPTHISLVPSTFHPCPAVQILNPILIQSTHFHSFLTYTFQTHPIRLIPYLFSPPLIHSALCHPHLILIPSQSFPFLSSSFTYPTYHLSFSYICLPNPATFLTGRSTILIHPHPLLNSSSSYPRPQPILIPFPTQPSYPTSPGTYPQATVNT